MTTFRSPAWALAAAGAVLTVALGATETSAEPATYFKAGVLTCAVGPGVGFVIGSSKSISCTFTPKGRVPEYYGGRIRKLGVDIGITGATVIVWGVLSAVDGFPVGALAGRYGGVSAEASLGLGLGANVLLGGSGSNFALQPVSVQSQIGLDIAAGITRLDLYAQ